MSRTAHITFFGDAEHVFDLAKPEIIRALETAVGSGIGALCARVMETRQFSHADLEHTLRLGLVGGGMDTKAAALLVGHYLPLLPLVEAQLVAVGVLAALWFGAPEPVAQPDPDAAAVLSNLGGVA
ncbi:gene transfer agent family protein [Methylobacterium oryzisoli]|uniref:gene transfer agent family protein n=1 Tax=Methylobacterium oryzisoli TaxID=3385502 RepID=UPI00397DB4D3